jgi:ABC-type transport system involved in multi-copper enzyme maturation permease subunit
MNCLPVIEMEMRSASRRRWTFVLRLMFAITGSVACLLVLVLPPLAPVPKGQTMLVLMGYLSLPFCLLAGGFLTADCVSSEKRDGTLGLLFLTPLTGMDIVLGKMVCHGLQMFYGLCAVFPVFFLPLLVGGVTWAEVSRIALALVLALLLGASVGVLVSVLATESRKSMLSTLSALVLIAAVPMVHLMVRQTFLASSAPMRGLPQFSPVFTVFSGFESRYGRSGGPFLFWGAVVASFALSSALVVVSGSILARVFAAMGNERNPSAQTHPIPLPEPGVLERNPYEWTLMRTAREAGSLGLLTHALVLFFAVMLVASVATSHWQAGFITAFFTAFAIHLLTKLRFAVEATRQINVDRQSGALELLLVTTLPNNGILEGHKRALRTLARKPMVLLIGLNLLLEMCVLLCPETLHMDPEATLMFSTFFLGGMALAAADFSALRCLGLLHGLRAPGHVRAALGAFSSTMLLPWIGMGLIIAVVSSTNPRPTGFAAILSLWMVVCVLYDWFLARSASTRLQAGLRRLASEGF